MRRRTLKNQLILILDFGGQYSQLIARRVRELNVYCEIVPYNISAQQLKAKEPKGIILTGGPASVLDEGAPFCDKEIVDLNIPILGICYGMQLLSSIMGGHIAKTDTREYGKVDIYIDDSSKIMKWIDNYTTCWMSHTYFVNELPEGFRTIARTSNCSNAAMENEEKKIYGVQFHPEVVHTPDGKKMLENFLINICKCDQDWKLSSFIDRAIQDIKKKVGNKQILCGLSGGVDSLVTAVITSKAVEDKLTCIFVDHGLLRKNEALEVETMVVQQFNINLVVVDASERFLNRLEGVVDPEEKRKIIGEEFIKVFEEQSKMLGEIGFLAQGTIYPDVIESGIGDVSATIKSHHNVGGLPENIEFEGIVEPLRELFKDEVRQVGKELGIPENIVNRQPFPGPGLAVRIIGEITQEKLEIVRESDYIFRDEILRYGFNEILSQYFTVLTGIKSVGVMGDERTYHYTVALRAVTTSDFMTAQWAKIPYEILEKISNRIVNEVRNVNRVVYDITTKPPASIEWE